MADDSKNSMVRGFLVGAGVVGMAAAGVMLSQPPAPSAAPQPAPPPMQAPMMGMQPLQQPAQPQPPPPATPREQADELFNQAMMASETKDQAALAQVLPSALAAYRALGVLDDDGQYHLALLELAGGDVKSARATCAGLLAKNPSHVLALGVGARVEQQAGDLAKARDLAGRLLTAFDAEATKPLREYQDHQRMLPVYRAEAEAMTRSK